MALHEEKTCSCGGKSNFSETAYLATQGERSPGVSEGWLNIDIYVCEACGRVEFYRPREVTEAEKLEALYRSYSDKKLQKIAEDEQYRQDARVLARKILDERSLTGDQ